ncbi:hypothetical protein Fleli_2815 [Bernardetia litoralis DSM 6794]|uniref:ATPase AAA-type core domain-containing protein n=1 Tax=Bernardetia litoralis (strain ATCC 23117 / DSM 6794 / NBRC 15988 / NCIMB 1366 / Fx l1 / Sio-4) TaxID=880071 RepID=I4AMI3_BERLS|nr:AAA family ATPase [Bernardetia litoralis]AFM05168.1 hypothetical protein Fleli_2815 [Bernardetia litoralis DSM 6794]
MKIIRFSFENKDFEWKLEEIKLNKLNLLVGASGVGKTQILKALVSLKEIAEGKSVNGVKWFIEFETIEQQNYIWEGEFEIINEEENFENDLAARIIFEKLFLNKKEIINRIADKIIFNGEQTIRLVQEQSVLHLLKEEISVKAAQQSIEKIYFTNQLGFAEKTGSSYFTNDKTIFEKHNTLEKIQESELKISIKLFLSSILKNDFTFKRINERFISIFPTVESLFVEEISHSIKKNSIEIYIKEKGVDKWIELSRMSWGMVRTLKQLSELYLCKEGTVFLIDEFENSLGINCINEITTDILSSKRQLQFILTSHHPYIINNIEFKNWKLVTRNAGIIKAHDMSEFDFGNSKHEVFMQLLQLDEYQTGQE